MKLAKLVQNLVDNKRTESLGTTGGPVNAIPYFRFSDFQRAITNCTDPTSVVLICGNPTDVIPHCIAHTTLLGMSATLLDDEILNNSAMPSSSAAAGGGAASSSSTSSFSNVAAANNKNSNNDGKNPLLQKLLNSNISTQHQNSSAQNQNQQNLQSERSILDVTNVKSATAQQVVEAVIRAAQAGTWLILPEVSALPLATWSEVGKLLQSASAATAAAQHQQELQRHDVSSSLLEQPGGVGGQTNNNNISYRGSDGGAFDEHAISPHFKFITFLTSNSNPLGRTLSPKVAQNIYFFDTRGVLRSPQELVALFSAVVPLTDAQLSLLAVGIGDGRLNQQDRDRENQRLKNLKNSQQQHDDEPGLNLAESKASGLHRHFGSSMQPLQQNRKERDDAAAAGGGAKLSSSSGGGSGRASGGAAAAAAASGGPPPSFFVDWPCAASLASAPVTLHSSDSATTSDYVDAALFALRETLLRALKDLLATANRLDGRNAAARKHLLEARAVRTGQDVSELEQIEEMRNEASTSDTNLTRLEKNPAWIYPVMHDWVVGCAPVVNIERLPALSFEELTVEDIAWVHEGIGDATACLRGTWQLAPVCLKCPLPSVRPAVTMRLNNKLIVEGRTLYAIRHPSITAVYGLAELPHDMSLIAGGNMVLRPLLSAAAMHERWLEAQNDAAAFGHDNNNNNSNNNDDTSNSMSNSTTTSLANDSITSLGAAAGGGGGAASSSSNRNQNRDGGAAAAGAANAQSVKQYALLVEPFEMSLEQCLVSCFDRNRPWTVEMMLDVAVSILRALVHISDTLVHRCVCPTNVVVCHGGAALTAPMAGTTTASTTSKSNSASPPPTTVAGGGARAAAMLASSSSSSAIGSPESQNTFQNQNQRQSSQSQYENHHIAEQPKLVCKLTQFGAAMPANRRCTPPWLTAALAAKLPIRYCAPETFWGNWSSASDVWSFGVTLWTMVHYCRRQPYEGATLTLPSAAARHREEQERLRLERREQRRQQRAEEQERNAVHGVGGGMFLSVAPARRESRTRRGGGRRRRTSLPIMFDTTLSGSPHEELTNENQQQQQQNEEYSTSGDDDDEEHDGEEEEEEESDDDFEMSPPPLTGVDCAGTVAEGVATGLLQLPPLSGNVPIFMWEIIRSCLHRRPQDRPDARSLISTIMLLKVRHKGSMNDLVDFVQA